MKLTFEVIDARKLDDGDIFYCTPDFEMNEFGPQYLITGTDQIFIRDDYFDEDEEGNHSVVVNGGHIIWFKKDEKIVKLGHYSNLVRIMEMVKEGNRDMNLGPNDIHTLIDDLPGNPPDLLEGLGDIFGEE